MNDRKRRCFISLDLSIDMRGAIESVQQHLQQRISFRGKYISREHVHLTLKFLGEIDDDTVKMVRQRLSDIESRPFTVSLSEAGVFSPKRVRIIWLHLLGAEQLQSLVDTALSDLFSPEHRFMSHITIARVKNLDDRKALVDAVKHAPVSSVSQTVRSFSLVQSMLTPDGPIYEVLERYHLK